VSEEKERFVSRWSRLKHDSRAEPQKAPVAESKAPEAPVPPLESVTPQSDFTPFMQPKVQEELRRLALKKLFRDPHFNVPDPFEPYSRDWNIADPIPPDLLAKLHHARAILLTPEERKALEEEEQAKARAEAQSIEQTPPDKQATADEPGSENT
jgi:hypothetical protein